MTQHAKRPAQRRDAPAQQRQTIRPFEKEHTDELGLERLIFFGDAVFAIAITLLALDIRLPAEAKAATDAELLAQLIGLGWI